KSQKKFQPKVRPKTERRPVEPQELSTEVATALNAQPDATKDSADAATSELATQNELPLRSDVTVLDPDLALVNFEDPTLAFKSVGLATEPSVNPHVSPTVKTNLASTPSESFTRNHTITPPTKPPATAIAAPQNITKGKAIAAPTPKQRTVQPKTYETVSPEAADKPFNILEYLKNHIKNTKEKTIGQKRQKAVENGQNQPKKPRVRPKKVTNTSTDGEPHMSENAQNPPKKPRGRSKKATSTSADNEPHKSECDVGSELADLAEARSEPCPSSMEAASKTSTQQIPVVMPSTVSEPTAEAEALRPVVEEQVTQPKRTQRRKNRVLPHRRLARAINEYTGTQPLDIHSLPFDVLCHSKLTYGEPLEAPTAVSRYSQPKREPPSAPITSNPKANNILAVQVKMVDGELVPCGCPMDYSTMEVIEEGAGGRHITCMTYVKRISSSRWTAEETEKFYEGLVKWGSDFELLCHELPHRERRHIVYKFKREEKLNPARIAEALMRRNHALPPSKPTVEP
ncbi:hypothetical protein L0F63_005686, partial [Massospora cicadina]